MRMQELFWPGLLAVFGAGTFLSAASPASDLMAGKVKTDRTIELEVLVDATPAEVFELWSTAEGVKTFFAPDARVDPRPGGAYEILFAPKDDPVGYSHGTTGARILRYAPPRELAFEWNHVRRGRSHGLERASHRSALAPRREAASDLGRALL